MQAGSKSDHCDAVKRAAIRAEDMPNVEGDRLPPAPRRAACSTMMKVEQVAERWDLNVKTVYGMIERGELSARRCGRVLRVPRSVVEIYESQASVEPERKKSCR